MRALEVTSKTTADGDPVLALAGELDIDTSGRVDQELRWIERNAPPVIVLDLRGLTFIDSTGLRLVASADSRARAAGRRLALVAGSGAVHRVFKITALDRRLEFTDPVSFGID